MAEYNFCWSQIHTILHLVTGSLSKVVTAVLAAYVALWKALINNNFFFFWSVIIFVVMPNKYGIVNCRGNYDLLSKCREFKLPRDDPERQKWLAVIPPRKDFDIANAKSFFVCEKHWPRNPPMKKLPGGTTRPAVAPSIFDVSASCLPTPQPPRRPAKQVDKQLVTFLAIAMRKRQDQII